MEKKEEHTIGTSSVFNPNQDKTNESEIWSVYGQLYEEETA